jgi:hypothetical protein
MLGKIRKVTENNTLKKALVTTFEIHVLWGLIKYDLEVFQEMRKNRYDRPTPEDTYYRTNDGSEVELSKLVDEYKDWERVNEQYVKDQKERERMRGYLKKAKEDHIEDLLIGEPEPYVPGKPVR